MKHIQPCSKRVEAPVAPAPGQSPGCELVYNKYGVVLFEWCHLLNKGTTTP